jgi:hypothetical protein
MTISQISIFFKAFGLVPSPIFAPAKVASLSAIVLFLLFSRFESYPITKPRSGAGFFTADQIIISVSRHSQPTHNLLMEQYQPKEKWE